MTSFLDLLGTIGGSILGLPGIFGFTFGLMTRNWLLAAGAGAVIGVLGPMLLGGSHSTHVPITTLEYSVGLIIGALAALTGCAIRRKGAIV